MKADPARPANHGVEVVGQMDTERRCTLDEPVGDTIMRDVRSVCSKLRYVLVPEGVTDGRQLQDWDLWGPLVLCLGLGLVIAMQAPDGEQASYAFADVFVIFWLGSIVVTVNAKLLQGKVSFFQTVCVLGYCVAPIVITAFAALLLRSTFGKVVLVLVGLVWASRASVGFVGELIPENKRLLGLYPVWLFYAAIAWLVVLAC